MLGGRGGQDAVQEVSGGNKRAVAVGPGCVMARVWSQIGLDGVTLIL